MTVWPENFDAKADHNAVSILLARNLGYAINELAKGMDEMAVALRATYLLLEKIDNTNSGKR